MKKVVIYPGRFQPMLSHHVKVFDYLKTHFKDYEVYIGTSNKVDEEKSPFNFKQKQMIAQAQGIAPERVLEAQQPYVHTFYNQFDHSDTIVIFAVGEKDMNTRFAMNNIDPDTGLDMKVRANKDTGEFEPKYYQMINSIGDTPQTMDKRGYLFEVPNIESDGEVESASAFRNALKNSPDKESAKQVFEKQFKEYNETVFNLIYDKIVGEKMSEDLNILMKLAGLEVQENAPVEFETNVEVKDIEFTPPSKSSSFHSIANRFPEGSDVNDPEVKKEEFIQALLRSPANLLAEINERISPANDNGLQAGEKLNNIIKQLEKEEGGITKLSDDDKKFTMEVVKKAIKEMDLEAGDDSPVIDDEPEMPEESLDLSDIKSDYGIEEGKDKVSNCCDAPIEGEIEDNVGRCSKCKEMAKCEDGVEEDEEIAEGGDCYHCDGKDEDCKHCNGSGYVQFDDDPNEPSQEEIDDNEAAYKKYIGKHKKDESVNESQPSEQSISDMSDEDLMDYVGQKEEELIDDMQQHIAPDFLHKDNYEETFEKYREEVLEPAAHDISQDAADGMEPADADYEESVEDTGNKALEAAMEELKKLAGLEEGECPKCGNKKHKLMACSSCGCS